MSDEVPIAIVVRPVTAHGWLRRPEFDTASTQAWELPDGRLCAMQKGRPAELVTVAWPPGGIARGAPS